MPGNPPQANGSYNVEFSRPRKDEEIEIRGCRFTEAHIFENLRQMEGEEGHGQWSSPVARSLAVAYNLPARISGFRAVEDSAACQHPTQFPR